MSDAHSHEGSRWRKLIQDVQASDPDESGPHAFRVGVIAEILYRKWATGRVEAVELEETAQVLRQAAMLHDVGKREVPAEFLRKASALTDEEFAAIRFHTVAGAAMFRDPEDAVERMASDVCMRHHERWDGSGYPGRDWRMEKGCLYPTQGLVGEDIPFAARIVALADVYDALCSERVYKPAWPESDVLAHLRAERGKHFDPEVVDCFFDVYSEIVKARQTPS